MTIEKDTEWLRERLREETFHREYPQKWIAVSDGRVVFSTSERQTMQGWLAQEDTECRCVLAFGEPRDLV
jgi:hypothetical protein